jgi:hypothetical protein
VPPRRAIHILRRKKVGRSFTKPNCVLDEKKTSERRALAVGTTTTISMLEELVAALRRELPQVQ